MNPWNEECDVGTCRVQEAAEEGRGQGVEEVDGAGGDGEEGCVTDLEVREDGVRGGKDVGEACGGGTAGG